MDIKVLLFLLIPIFAWGQKFEKESKISLGEFPDSAMSLLNKNYPERGNTKYFREISQDSITYEAKFNLDGEKYSVEFFSNGSLMDVEKEIPWKSMDENLKENLEEKFNTDFNRYKVDKVQLQTSEAGQRYEIVVKGKSEDGIYYYEYLFDDRGDFIRKLKIVLRPTDMNIY